MELLSQEVFTASEIGCESTLQELLCVRLCCLDSDSVEECLNCTLEATEGRDHTRTTVTCTPLIIAIVNENSGCVKLLLNHMKNRSSINKTDSNGYSPLIHALERRQNEVVSLLLEKGADVNQITDKRYSPLLCAVAYGDVVNVTRLLECGAKPDECDGESALIVAARQDRCDIMSLLLRYGANPNFRNRTGDTALYFSVLSKNVDAVKELMRRGADAYLFTGDSALMIASRSNDIDMVKAMINFGVNLNLQNAFGETALHFAAREGHVELYIILFLRGINWRLRRKSRKNIADLHFWGGGSEIALSLFKDPWIKRGVKHDMLAEMWWWNRKSFMMFCWMLLASTSNEGLPDVPTVKVFLIADLTRYISGYLGPSTSDLSILDSA